MYLNRLLGDEEARIKEYWMIDVKDERPCPTTFSREKRMDDKILLQLQFSRFNEGASRRAVSPIMNVSTRLINLESS